MRWLRRKRFWSVRPSAPSESGARWKYAGSRSVRPAASRTRSSSSGQSLQASSSHYVQPSSRSSSARASTDSSRPEGVVELMGSAGLAAVLQRERQARLGRVVRAARARLRGVAQLLGELAERREILEPRAQEQLLARLEAQHRALQAVERFGGSDLGHRIEVGPCEIEPVDAKARAAPVAALRFVEADGVDDPIAHDH